MSKIAVLFFPLFLLMGCGHTYKINALNSQDRAFSRLDLSGSFGIGRMITTAGDTLHGKKFAAVNDSIQFLDRSAKKLQRFPFKAIDRIDLKNRRAGAAGGFLIGLGSGAAVSMMFIDQDAEMAGLAVLVYSALSGVAGGIAGAIIGEHERYVFPQPSQHRSPKEPAPASALK